MSLPAPLSYLVSYCENLCVKECCGIEAFDFSPVHIASWLHQSRGEPTTKTVADINEQLNAFRDQFGSASNTDGYESSEDEMNQIFSPEQVDQLVEQIATNLKHAIALNQESNQVQWKPEGVPSTTDHRPEMGNALVRAMSWRYATKKFDPDRHVRPEDLETILNATNLSASSYGLQPFQFVVIQDKSLQEQLMPMSYNQPQVRDASAVIVFAVRTNVDEDYIRQSAKLTEEVRGLPPGTLNDYAKQMIGAIMSMDDEQRIAWASKQTYLLMGTALAACAMLGIDACPMEGFVADQYDEMLSLREKNLHTSLVLPIGYRAADDVNGNFAKVRHPLDEMVIRIG
jgi:nitroreductase